MPCLCHAYAMYCHAYTWCLYRAYAVRIPCLCHAYTMPTPGGAAGGRQHRPRAQGAIVSREP
eukprot:scaffold95415_cov24-Phaeocystis_antarctica.AAC.1